jgi:hypothetical protein
MSQPSQSESRTNPKEHDLAYAVLMLERQLDTYQRLHEEEIASLRAAMKELKRRILDVQSADAEGRLADNNSQTHHPS